MSAISERPLTFDELLETHTCGQGELLTFAVEEGWDVYNPAPYLVDGEVHLLSRVEKQNGKISHLKHFMPGSSVNGYVPNSELPIIPLAEDAFIKFINGQVVQGIVKVKQIDGDEVEALHTEISVGKELVNRRPLVVGPPGMKDIRLFQMPGERVGALTRPEDPIAKTKGVNLTFFDSLEEVTAEGLRTAPAVPGLQSPIHGEHRGGNEGRMLANGYIGYLGHIARVGSDMYKEYVVETAYIDPDTLEVHNQQVVACPNCFPVFRPKTDHHEQVVFPQGIVDGRLYVGLGDAACGMLRLNS